MDKILILDFGSQTCQLIGRRIREKGIYTDIVPGDIPFKSELLTNVKGIIFSGSPYSVYQDDAPSPDNRFYQAGLPILGICYGFQRMVHDHNGSVEAMDEKEYGAEKLYILQNTPLFAELPKEFRSWMSHGDSIARLPDKWVTLARSKNHLIAATNPDYQWFGLQFHPEVTHCEFGTEILYNFAYRICKAKKEWTLEKYVTNAGERIRQKVGNSPVLLLISGGVDSSVVAALLLSELPSEQIHLMYIDTGLMRHNENDEVTRSLKELGAKNLYLIDASKHFLELLQTVSDPEEKRRIIGDTFINTLEREVQSRITGEYFLAQGTLYTDLIESGKGIGKKAKVIKSHHNVRSPLVEAKRSRGLIIEPLEFLYKDEVRRLGKYLGLHKEVIDRHPFPGPGLAVRILGEVTKEKCDILRRADYLYIQQLKTRDLYDKIWQAFCVLLPIKSVGVSGDSRRYGYVIALRAIISSDGMTADIFPFPSQDLLEISSLITNRIPEVGRVVYDVTSKPPATIEWE